MCEKGRESARVQSRIFGWWVGLGWVVDRGYSI